MPSKTRSEAEAWLQAGKSVSGVLAWNAGRAPLPKASPHVRAAAVALVSPGLPVTKVVRVRAVEALLSKLEQVEGDNSSQPKRKYG